MYFVWGLWKENLNSDDYQFHQYQQNEQSPLVLIELTQLKKTTTCDVGNPRPGLGQAHKCVGIKPTSIRSWYLDLQQQYIYKQTITNLHWFASTQTDKYAFESKWFYSLT